MTHDDRYLWDKSGPPDPFVAELERALAPLAHKTDAPAPRGPRARGSFGASAIPLVFTAAACAAFVLVAREPGLEVTFDGGATTRLTQSAALETRGNDAAAIDLGPHGVVNVRNNSRVRLVSNERDQQELFLERGELHAIVNAPPRFFTVGTPVARAVDLGCEYTLAVDERTGATVVIVTKGAVSLEDEDDITLVPAGASARADRGSAVLPYATRTSPELRAAAEAGDVGRILSIAQRVDAITLWHIVRTQRDLKALDKLFEVFPPPYAVNSSNALTADALFMWLNEIEAELAP